MATEKSENFISSLTKLIITTFVTALITHFVTKMFEEQKAEKEVTTAKREVKTQADSSSQKFLEVFNVQMGNLQEENSNLKQQISKLQGTSTPADNGPARPVVTTRNQNDFTGHWVESTGGAELKLMNNSIASLNGVGEVSGLISGSGSYKVDGNYAIVTFANAYLFGESVGSLTYELNMVGTDILNGSAISVLGNNPIAFYRN